MKTPLGTSGQATDIFDDEFDVEVVGKSDFAAMAKKITILEVSPHFYLCHFIHIV